MMMTSMADEILPMFTILSYIYIMRMIKNCDVLLLKTFVVLLHWMFSLSRTYLILFVTTNASPTSLKHSSGETIMSLSCNNTHMT